MGPSHLFTYYCPLTSGQPFSTGWANDCATSANKIAQLIASVLSSLFLMHTKLSPHVDMRKQDTPGVYKDTFEVNQEGEERREGIGHLEPEEWDDN